MDVNGARPSVFDAKKPPLSFKQLSEKCWNVVLKSVQKQLVRFNVHGECDCTFSTILWVSCCLNNYLITYALNRRNTLPSVSERFALCCAGHPKCLSTPCWTCAQSRRRSRPRFTQYVIAKTWWPFNVHFSAQGCMGYNLDLVAAKTSPHHGTQAQATGLFSGIFVLAKSNQCRLGKQLSIFSVYSEVCFDRYSFGFALIDL